MTVLAAVLSSSSSNSTLNEVEPGVLGFLVVAAMGLALFFLLRSMNKQFRKLGPPPEEADAESAAGEAGSTGPQAAAAVKTGDAKQDAKAEGATKRE